MLRAVFDPNVFASAVLQPQGPSGQLLARFLRDASFEVVITPAIVEEVMQVLTYPKLRKRVRGNLSPDLWFEDVLALTHIVDDRLPPGVAKNPGDDKYLAAAREGLATFVVTDEPGFLAMYEFDRVRIVTPEVFLEQLATPPPA
ncbi:MAG: putative toxin-antitoxin system toxin component, PIN family [Gemmatimonadetes bacterium]|nr:putative toxin-antitoxin system toxin component, PIN family [Gemmatimonadota bacterium]